MTITLPLPGRARQRVLVGFIVRMADLATHRRGGSSVLHRNFLAIGARSTTRACRIWSLAVDRVWLTVFASSAWPGQAQNHTTVSGKQTRHCLLLLMPRVRAVGARAGLAPDGFTLICTCLRCGRLCANLGDAPDRQHFHSAFCLVDRGRLLWWCGVESLLTTLVGWPWLRC